MSILEEEKVTEKIYFKKFPNLRKDKNIQIPKFQKTPIKYNQQKSSLRHSMAKPLEV